MGITRGFVGAVGHTPLIRLEHFSAVSGCEILGKAEFMNPGGSVKDRAALGILQAAEAAGELQKGGTVVEGTAGNTGIGLAHLCNARGYRCVIVIPETQSAEKIGLLRSLGAEVRTVPAVPYRDPNNYVRLSGRIAAEIPGAIWANQFDNQANRQAHYSGTGPEIWEQCAGKLDAWVAATGTGGTYAGSKENLSFGLLYRKQWIQIEDAPTTFSFSGSAPVGKNVGLGLSIRPSFRIPKRSIP
ncbi:MAG: pyridoxal-phosphate dependent enzyme, partial [Synechococcaceae bacterium WB5_2A_257]|nr:pyridoxal-phosphate dependent enzyme [Synechococcaceae bacterium WB5_2A_257]